MAAPPEVTIKNLSGTYTMNYKLSDNNDAFFTMQGLSWVTRKAINAVSVVLTIKEYEMEGKYHVDITSVAAGFSKTQENRTLDWTERDHQDKIFGNVKGRSRIFQKADFEKVTDGSDSDTKFLIGETLKDGSPSSFVGDEHIQSIAVNQDAGYGWSVEQIWGFEEVEGQRHYTRRLVCRKDGNSELMRIVYDYKGPPDAAKEGEDDELAYGED